MKFYPAALVALYLLFGCVTDLQAQNISDHVVQTRYGPVRGREHTTLFYGRPYYSYRGIPFAQAPIGELRFKPPQPAKPWQDVFNATEFGNICTQPGVESSEDCLSLNVFVPAYTPRITMPVVIAIHGGSFISGMSEHLGPDFLLNQDQLIVVTMNYRLGPMGFLSLNTSDYSGNMGLKDQLLAIKWVNENIQYFGGDPDAVTLYGFSAGSTSAHLHVLSPASQGLFRRAIMASGVAVNPFSITRADHLPILFEYARRNGSAVQNVDQLIEYLKVLDANEFVAQTEVAAFETGVGRLEVDVFWGPRVENADAVEPFLLESPVEVLANNFHSDIDTLFGYCSAESYIFMNDELVNPSLIELFDEQFKLHLPLYSLNFDLDFESEQFRRIQPLIRDFYFGHNDGTVNRTTLFEYAQMISDITFNYGVDWSVKKHAASSSGGRTFYYRFAVEGIFNLIRWLTEANILGLPGATHGDDIFYAFATDGVLSALYNIVSPDSLERRVINEYSRFYTNFIMYGSPTLDHDEVQLDVVRPGEVNFADFTNERFTVSRDPWSSHMQFWDDLIAEHFAEAL